MKKNRWIFYLIFGIYHVGAFIFTIILENNTSLLFNMVKFVPWFKWITLIGLVLLVIDIVWDKAALREGEKENVALSQELNTLKAKLFDLQEANRATAASRPSSNPKV
jgi:hypothetical protein